MNHTKKMILVPHETVARLHDTPTSSPQTQMSALDTEMSYIMRKQYADDSEKWKKYNEVLQRYLYFANESRKPVEISLSLPEEKREQESPLRQQLASIVPKTYKGQALRIFDYLSQSGSPVTWDSTGVVTAHGSVIPHSHIIELISDLIRSRKHVEPSGVSPFIHALAQMNVPLDLIGNEKRRASIQQMKQGPQKGSGIVLVPSDRVTKRVSKKHVWKAW